MESNPTAKTLKFEGIDRISDLPDSILGKILSFLPTKTAVATTILCSRWKSIFPFAVLPFKLNIDDSLLLQLGEDNFELSLYSFLGFVDRLFNKTLVDIPYVETLFLHCEKDYYYDATIISWVAAALRLNPKLLDLNMYLYGSKDLLQKFHGCKSLASLTLGINFALCVPDAFSLPNLKSLYLNKITFDGTDGKSINELIAGCPSLETLSISGCYLLSMECLYVRSFVLKELTIQYSWNSSKCKLVLDTPNLEILFYDDCAADGYVISSFNSIRRAHVDVGPSQQQMVALQKGDDYDEPEELASYCEELVWYDNGVARFIAACSSTVSLSLGYCSIDALHRSTVKLPTFCNLKTLALGSLGRHGWALLAHILSNAPNLEKLIFKEEFNKHEEGYGNFEVLLPTPPLCLESSLKEIEFWVFTGEKDEIKLIDYFTRNGKALKKIKIPSYACCMDASSFFEIAYVADEIKDYLSNALR